MPETSLALDPCECKNGVTRAAVPRLASGLHPGQDGGPCGADQQRRDEEHPAVRSEQEDDQVPAGPLGRGGGAREGEPRQRHDDPAGRSGKAVRQPARMQPTDRPRNEDDGQHTHGPGGHRHTRRRPRRLPRLVVGRALDAAGPQEGGDDGEKGQQDDVRREHGRCPRGGRPRIAPGDDDGPAPARGTGPLTGVGRHVG